MASPTVIGTNTSRDNTGAAETSSTFSFTVASGQNRYLIGAMVDGAGKFVTSATYNSVAMTEIFRGDYTNVEATTSLGLVDPTAGANNIVFNFASSAQDTCFAMCLQDAAQSATVDGTGKNSPAAGTSCATSVTTATNGCLIVHVTGTNSAATSLTQNAGQTEQLNLTKGGTDIDRKANVGTIPQVSLGAISIGITWTNSSTADQHAFGIKYLAPTPVATTTRRRVMKHH